MKKFSFAVFLGTFMSFIAVIGVFAADITNAIYKADIVVTNNGTATTNQSTIFTLNTSQLIDQNFVNSALNNTALINNAGGDNPFMPGASDNQSWVVWVTSIGGATTNDPYVLYMGGNQSMKSQIRYFPGAEGMNVTDNASLELGANFTINQTGFIDTSAGANKTLVYKPGAFQTLITSNGNVSSSVYGVNSTITQNRTPEGSGNLTQWPTLVGAATHWQAMLTNDGNTSYIAQTSAVADVIDLFSVANLSSGSVAVTAVTVYIIASANNSVADSIVFTTVRTNGANYNGGEINLKSGSTNQSLGQYLTFNTTYATNPNTGVAWTLDEVNNLEIGVGGRVAAGQYVRVTQVFVVITVIPTVVASNVPSGNHTITTSLVSGNLSISVDGVLNDSLAVTGSTTNNANAWQFCTANTTPYVQEVSITVNGTQQARWTWGYSSTLPVYFYDLASNGHTATPTMRTTLTSANVTANMTTFEPLSQTTSTVTNPSVASYNLTSNFTTPSGLYTELNITAPGAAWLNEILDGADIPRALVWFPIIFGFINLIGLGMYAVTKSVMIQALVVGFLIMLASLMGGFGYWVVIEYCIMALAMVIASKQFGW